MQKWPPFSVSISGVWPFRITFGLARWKLGKWQSLLTSTAKEDEIPDRSPRREYA